MTTATTEILGTKVTAATFAEAQNAVAEMVAARRGEYVSCANIYSLMLACDDPRYRAVLNQARLVTPDGVPIVWAIRSLGGTTERVHNDDLVLGCCERFPEWKHFLVGGRDGQPEAAAAELRRRIPEIRIVGVHATPIRPVPDDETDVIVARIRASGADVVWVGMGTPAQDFWSSRAAPLAGVPMVGCGSLFDLLTGRTRPAPEWMKRAGLQWLHRLWQEPRRLACRYGYYNPRFLWAFGRQWMSHRSAPRAETSGERDAR